MPQCRDGTGILVGDPAPRSEVRGQNEVARGDLSKAFSVVPAQKRDFAVALRHLLLPRCADVSCSDAVRAVPPHPFCTRATAVMVAVEPTVTALSSPPPPRMRQSRPEWMQFQSSWGSWRHAYLIQCRVNQVTPVALSSRLAAIQGNFGQLHHIARVGKRRLFCSATFVPRCSCTFRT